MKRYLLLVSLLVYLSLCYGQEQTSEKPPETITVFLNNGEVVKGEVIEKKYGEFIKLKSNLLGVVEYKDADIDSASVDLPPEKQIKRVQLKTGEVVNGEIIEETSSNTIKLKTQNLGIIELNRNLIDKIEEKPQLNNTATNSKIILKNGSKVNGVLTDSTDSNISILTNKYGVIEYHRSEIKSIASNTKNKNVTKTDSNIELVNILEDLSLNQLSMFVFMGVDDITLYYYHIGLPANVFNKGDFYVSPEVQLGLISDTNYLNVSLNILPAQVYYNVYNKIFIELGPELYMRFFQGGLRTRLGVMAGSTYMISDKINLGLRLSINKDPYYGIKLSYKIL